MYNGSVEIKRWKLGINSDEKEKIERWDYVELIYDTIVSFSCIAMTLYEFQNLSISL